MSRKVSLTATHLLILECIRRALEMFNRGESFLFRNTLVPPWSALNIERKSVTGDGDCEFVGTILPAEKKADIVIHIEADLVYNGKVLDGCVVYVALRRRSTGLIITDFVYSADWREGKFEYEDIQSNREE